MKNNKISIMITGVGTASVGNQIVKSLKNLKN